MCIYIHTYLYIRINLHKYVDIHIYIYIHVYAYIRCVISSSSTNSIKGTRPRGTGQE